MNLIGINGRIKAGKDLTTKLIQKQSVLAEIESGRFSPQSVPSMEMLLKDYSIQNSDWKNRKFAYKLKLIVSILIGCRVEDLESQAFKDKVLPSQWNRWVVYEVQTGKVKKIFLTESEAKEWVLMAGLGKIFYDYKFQPITVRLMLQWVGTEAFRDVIHPNTWVNALFADFVPVKQKTDEEEYENILPKWIISDMRFPNEYAAIKERGGICIRVNRKGTKQENEHESERALDNHTFDFEIDNNDSADHLEKQVIDMIRKFQVF